MIISTNDKFLPEKKYVFDFVFNEILNLKYEVQLADNQAYSLLLDQKCITIKDDFFARIKTDDYKYYDDEKLLPTEIQRIDNQQFSLERLPIIYGEPVLVSESNGSIYCGIDIFASIFFMLTRWEERANGRRDKHGRFVETENTSVKFNFYKRPVVNEYIDLLRRLLLAVAPDLTFGQRRPQLFLTTDVDIYAKYNTMYKKLKTPVGDLLKRRSNSLCIKSLREIRAMLLGHASDPYDTFDYLMSAGKQLNARMIFYFIAGKKHEADVDYAITNKKVVQAIQLIESQGFSVGLHSSYSAFDKPARYGEEMLRLSGIVAVGECRHHYLRFAVPDTWQHLDKAGLNVDSSVGFSTLTGFRAGICHEYPVFDIVARRRLRLRERPLIVMDTAMKTEHPDNQSFMAATLELAEVTRRYSGDFVILWHNTSFNSSGWYGMAGVWDEIMRNLKELW